MKTGAGTSGKAFAPDYHTGFKGIRNIAGIMFNCR